MDSVYIKYYTGNTSSRLCPRRQIVLCLVQPIDFVRLLVIFHSEIIILLERRYRSREVICELFLNDRKENVLPFKRFPISSDFYWSLGCICVS